MRNIPVFYFKLSCNGENQSYFHWSARTANLRQQQHLFKYFSQQCNVAKLRRNSGLTVAQTWAHLGQRNMQNYLQYCLITCWLTPIKLCLGMWDIEQQLLQSSPAQLWAQHSSLRREDNGCCCCGCSGSIPGALFNFICQTAVINNRWNDR